MQGLTQAKETLDNKGYLDLEVETFRTLPIISEIAWD